MWCVYVDEAKLGLSRAVQKFENQYMAHKRLMVPVESLSAPHDDIANRALDMDHVKVLMNSFRTTQRINEDIMVAARTDAVPPKPELLTPEWLLAAAPRLEVIAGHHSVEAVKLLHSQYPANRLFAMVPCKVFVCPDTGESRQYLRAIGGFDNLIKAIQRKSSKTEITLQIRRHLEAEVIGLPDREKARKLKDLKETWKTIYALNKATLGTIIVLCNKPPEIWDLIEQLLTGKGMEKGYHPPSNPAPFNQIGGLESDWVVKELTKLKSGEMTLSQFHNSCLREKNRLKVVEWVQDLIIRVGKKRTPAELEAMSWDGLAELYPLTTQPDFISSLCAGVRDIPKKSGPPEVFKKAVAEWLRQDEEMRREVHLFTVMVMSLSLFYASVSFLLLCVGFRQGF